MRNIFVLLLFLLLFSIPTQVLARSGCCSHHGGVCGCRCCDGTSLSAKCAPYYPSCGSSKKYNDHTTDNQGNNSDNSFWWLIGIGAVLWGGSSLYKLIEEVVRSLRNKDKKDEQMQSLRMEQKMLQKKPKQADEWMWRMYQDYKERQKRGELSQAKQEKLERTEKELLRLQKEEQNQKNSKNKDLLEELANKSNLYCSLPILVMLLPIAFIALIYPGVDVFIIWIGNIFEFLDKIFSQF